MGQQRTSDQEIRSLVGAPDGYTVLNLVALREKVEVKPAYTDEDLPWDVVHIGTY